MRAYPLIRPALLFIALAIAASPALVLAQDAGAQFKEGYYQQTHERNYAAAAAAYEQVAGNASAPEALRAEAKTRLAQCREDEATEDLARLMPPDALAFIEINRPGKHVGRLIQMLGLGGEKTAGATAEATPLPGGLTLPADFAISPALLRELEKGRGIAVAITGIEPNRPPHGVAVIHPGDADVPRGLIETAIQVLPQSEPIAGFRVHHVQNDVVIAVTNRLYIVSDTRDAVEQAIARLQNKEADSLAKQPQFAQLADERADSLVFAYVDGKRAVQLATPHLRGQEAMMARMLLDLDHLESVSASVGTTDQGIHAQARVVLSEGHRNLAYGIIRTAPMSQRSLAHVPAGAAAVAVFGLNPAGPSGGRSSSEPPSVTAMDIGREVFANVEEVSLYVLSAGQGEAMQGMPEVGMIAAVKDPAKSEALWDQLLSLASMFGPRVAQRPQEIELEGHKARQYQFQGAPPVVVVRLPDGAMAAGTRGAVTAAIRAQGETAFTADPQFRPLVSAIRPESSKAVMVNVGRAMSLGAAMSSGRDREEIQQIASLIGDLKVMVVTNEAPNQFTVRASATGLPDVPAIFHTFARARTSRIEAMVRSERGAVQYSAPVEVPPPSPARPAPANGAPVSQP